MAPLSTPTTAPAVGVRPARRLEPSRRGAAHPRPATAPADSWRAAEPANAVNAATLQERARIARELHDTVSQTLYAIMLNASRARRFLEQNDGDSAQRIVEDVLQLANTGQTELRALMADL